MTGHREGAAYVPPATLPPKPPWLKLGARVAVLTPVSDKCASGVVAVVYEIRPTADGETWEVGVVLFGRSLGRHRLNTIALWEEAI